MIPMETMQLAPPFPTSCSFNNYPICSNFKPEKPHIATPLSVNVDGNTTLNSAAVKESPTWKPRGNIPLRRENLLKEDNANFNYYISLLEACAKRNELEQAHAQMFRSGLDQNIFLGTKLVSMYAACGSLENARRVFDRMHKRNVFLWNVMIREYARNGLCEEAIVLFYQMQLAGIRLDSFTFPIILKACAGISDAQRGKEIHGYIIRRGLESNVFVGNSAVAMYAKCGSVELACKVFDRMSQRSVVSWNAMIFGYAQNGRANEAVTLFHQMQEQAEVKPNSVTIVNVLQACADLGALQEGKWIHDYIVRTGSESDVTVGNSLVAMYAKCGGIEIARHLFDKMPERDVASWNEIIVGYARDGHPNEVLTLFKQMQRAETRPDSVTMASVLQACAHLGALQQGKCIHAYVKKSGIESDVFVGSSLVDMYAKCGSIENARLVFDKMSQRSVVSWTAMIAGYAQNGRAGEALTLFHQMRMAEMTPNSITVVSVLQACAHLGTLKQGKWIHAYIIRSGIESDVLLGTALIDMYAKCGIIKLARQLFDKMSERDVITWSAMIAGYGMHGFGEDALALFGQMQQVGTKPDHVTFIGVLSACSHAGLVDEGWQCFDCMQRDYCITPRMEHYACMVDLLGRAGHLDEAQDFIKRMPLEPHAGVWGTLLGACRIHCNVELAERVAENLLDLEPENAGWYVLLSNIYAAAGRWDDVANVRQMMKDKGVKKTPGCSLIEVNNTVHAFLVGDRSHPQSEKIYATLESLAGQLEAEGYVPNTNLVLHDVEEEIKEHMICTHSEKLAIAFGLINTSPGTSIRIIKNLRMCGDCHSVSKFISKIVNREIIVRDANRFHHFKDGLCSCQDYW